MSPPFLLQVQFGPDSLRQHFLPSVLVEVFLAHDTAPVQFPESDGLAAQAFPAAQVAAVAEVGFEIDLVQQALCLEGSLGDGLAARGGGYGPLVLPAWHQVGDILAGSAGGEAVIPAPIAFLDMQRDGSGGGVGRPGNGVRGRDVGFAGAAAGIVQDPGGLVFGVGIGNLFQVFLHIGIRCEEGLRLIWSRRRGRGGVPVIPVVAFIAVIAIVPVAASLLARGLRRDRNLDLLGWLVAGKQQRQGDKEERKQSLHGGIL